MSSQTRHTLGTIDSSRLYMSRTDLQSITLALRAWSCGQPLMDSRPPAEHAVLRGHLFEFYCLSKLAQGGRFPMRSLDEPGELCMPSNGAMQQI